MALQHQPYCVLKKAFSQPLREEPPHAELRRYLVQVLAAKLLMQKRVDAAAADLDKGTKRAEAAASAGAGDDMLRAAIRRRRACQVL